MGGQASGEPGPPRRTPAGATGITHLQGHEAILLNPMGHLQQPAGAQGDTRTSPRTAQP